MPKAFEFAIKQVIGIFQPLKWHKAHAVITAVFKKFVTSRFNGFLTFSLLVDHIFVKMTTFH